MLGASFEPNHVVAMKQCNTVDSPSSRSAVGGKSEKKTQRRIDSFRVLLPPKMTVKDETSDGLTSTTEETPTTRQQEETNIEPQLKYRTPTEQEELNSQQDWHILGLAFRTPGDVLSLPQETVWEVDACLQKLPGFMV